MEGGDTELDRQLIEVIRDPLTHILRNAADHGIEPPHERVARGKPETGSIRLAASHEAGYITVAISDDGRGLDLETHQGEGARARPRLAGRSGADGAGDDLSLHLRARVLDRRDGHEHLRSRRRPRRRA